MNHREGKLGDRRGDKKEGEQDAERAQKEMKAKNGGQEKRGGET